MLSQYILIIAILFPMIAGFCLLISKEAKKRNVMLAFVGVCFVVELVLCGLLVFCDVEELCVLELMRGMSITFKVDALGKIFIAVMSIVWVLAGFFSFTYMKHEWKNNRFFGFFLVVMGILVGIGAAGNLLSFYVCFELMTLASFPLVIHSQSHDAIMAALKYMFYSFFGAYMALFGLFFLCKYCVTIRFVPGGSLDMTLVQGNETLLLVCALLMIVGFGVKAGMFPVHAWLPTAHPIAPAPASAVLSAVIVKVGAFAIIRVIFYLFGASFIRGTWLHTLFLALAIWTVFMGSMLAYKEKVLKKRLAYSTVSQLSYILFGIALLDKTAFTGAMLHIIAHAFIKCALFLVAGAIIYKTGKTRVDELRGIGKQMPVTLWCYTIVSLGLIGIPPTGGFVSKWYLATGALNSDIAVFRYLGPIVLLVSALLTAGYLLPITINGFFPGEDFDYSSCKVDEGSKWMTIPLIILSILALCIGMFPNGVVSYVADFVNGLM